MPTPEKELKSTFTREVFGAGRTRGPCPNCAHKYCCVYNGKVFKKEKSGEKGYEYSCPLCGFMSVDWFKR